MINLRTYKLAIEFYKSSRNLKLPGYLKDQLGRAASSIVLNLAEGYGRPTRADQKRFFSIAMGSLRECQAVIELADNPSAELGELSDKLAAHLYKLINYCP